MNEFIELLKIYTGSNGYKEIEEKGAFTLVIEKRVNEHLFRVSVNDELTSKGLFHLSILNLDNVVVAYTHMRISEFMDFNDLLDVSLDNLYNGLCL